MSSYQQLLNRGRSYLTEHQVPQGDLDAWLLLEHVLGRDRSWYFLHMTEESSDSQAEEYENLLKQRGRRIPLQQILGTASFMGLEFKVNSQVLIPRQDTESLVEEALKRLKPESKILDLCTGSGCILLSLLYNIDKCTGTGADISPAALEVAMENSRRLGVQAEFVESNLFAEIQGQYHMIVSNPPYIPAGEIDGLMEEVRDYEPHLALDGGEDGLDFYRKIIREAGAYLVDGGWLIMEIGCEQGADVSAYLHQYDYREVEIVRDLAGLDRVVLGRKYQEDIHV